jgi:hypothetical protein
MESAQKKSAWHSIRIPNHYSEQVIFGSKIDKDIHDRFQNASKRFGWGGKRRLLEAAIVKILDEVDFEE